MVIELSPLFGMVLIGVVYALLVAAMLLLTVAMLVYAYQLAYDAFICRTDWRCLVWCYWTLVKGKDSDKVLRYYESLDRFRIKSHASLPDAGRVVDT